MIATDNVPLIDAFSLEARLDRILMNTNKTKTEALIQARAELLQEQAHEANIVNYMRDDCDV